MLLKDKVVLVTGASAGIGRAVAIEAARQGADVAINHFDSTDDTAEKTVAAIRAEGRRGLAVRSDVARPESATAFIDAAVAALQTPVTPGAGTANLTNAISTAMGKLANTLNNVITVQASVGGRENEVTALQTVTQSNNLQTQSNLADLTQTNLTQVISKYTMVQFSLQAAQQGFSMIQKMSLFNYIGD